MRKIFIISSLILLFAVITNGQVKRFSDYRKGNGLVFVSGQIGTTAGKEVSFEEEVDVALRHVSDVLGQSGTNMSKVVSVTVYLTDLKSFAAFNEVYGRYFTSPYPARTCVVVKELVQQARVEISVVASK